MEIYKFFALTIGGFIAAFYGSTVGGMGLITLPMFILFGLPLPLAIGTNRLVSLSMDVTSSLKFYREKKLVLKKAILIGMAVSVGSFVGAQLLSTFPEQLLKYCTAVILLVALLLNLFKINIKPVAHLKAKHYLLGAVILFFLGIYGGLIGIAFGTLIIFVPPFFGHNLVESAGIARVAGVMMSLTATSVFLTQNMINFSYAIPTMLGVIAGSWFGVSTSVKKGDQYVKVLMTVSLVVSLFLLFLR